MVALPLRVPKRPQARAQSASTVGFPRALGTELRKEIQVGALWKNSGGSSILISHQGNHKEHLKNTQAWKSSSWSLLLLG